MAFAAAKLSRIGGNESVQLWIYYSDDASSVVDDADYFLSVVDDFNVGDIILCACNVDATIEYTRLVVTNLTTTFDTSTNVTQ
jgi:hypothetical protein